MYFSPQVKYTPDCDSVLLAGGSSGWRIKRKPGHIRGHGVVQRPAAGVPNVEGLIRSIGALRSRSAQG